MRPVYDGEFPLICGDCGEAKRYEGTRKKQVIACGCAPVARIKTGMNTARKGRIAEKAELRKLEQLGVGRLRMQPGSGSIGTRNNESGATGDNSFTVAGKSFRQEVKSRANDSGFKVLKGWMRDCHVLTVKQDREPPLHVLSDEAWLHLVGAALDGAERVHSETSAKPLG